MAIDSLDDMETLFDGIDLGEVSTSMTINAPAAVMLAFYVVAAERQGIGPERLAGTIQNDILKEFIAQKEWCFPPDPAMRLVTDMIEFCARAHAALAPGLDLAATTSARPARRPRRSSRSRSKDGFTYVEQAVERGLDVDDFAPRLSFFFNAHIDFFEEIAKYRAARRIWARELRDTYGAQDERSLLMRFHSQTAGVSLTAQQPLNNLVRTATRGARGGAGRHAVAAHQLLRRGARAADRGGRAAGAAHAADHRPRDRRDEHVDPLGGSYFVEALTDRMEEAAYDYFAKIDELGGMVEAIKQNFPQREIADAAFALPGGDRVAQADHRRGQPLPAARRRDQSRSCASRPSSSASRSGASRRCARAATATPSRRARASCATPPPADAT